MLNTDNQTILNRTMPLFLVVKTLLCLAQFTCIRLKKVLFLAVRIISKGPVSKHFYWLLDGKLKKNTLKISNIRNNSRNKIKAE